VVDRLVDGASRPLVEAIARGAKIRRVRDEASIDPTAADTLVGVSDRRVTSAADIDKGLPDGLANRRVRYGAAPHEGAAVGDRCRHAGRDLGEIEALQADGRRGPPE
jgi:hypothetical protein